MSRLVLTRKLDEAVIIHDGHSVIAKIKISKIDRNQVRLTLEAESKIKIDRQEIFNQPPK